MTADLANTLYLDLEWGRVTIELRPDLAPGHCARIRELAGEGFYDGIVFHRVIDGFMAQTGDPTGTGMGGSENPNSADSQFFIMLDEGHFLNGQYTVWGKVVDGMDHVDRIAKGEPPKKPDKIVKMSLADAAK